MLFESSQDLLYIILSVCALWFTVFLCWLLFQAARFVRNANLIVENVTEKLEMLNEAVNVVKKKMEVMNGHMGLVSSLASTLVEKFIVQKMGAALEKRTGEKSAKKATKRR